MRIPNLKFLARRVNTLGVSENNKSTYTQGRQTQAERRCEIKSSPFSTEVFSFYTIWFAHTTCFHSSILRDRVVKAIPYKPECNWSHDYQQNNEDEEGVQCFLESAGQRLVHLAIVLVRCPHLWIRKLSMEELLQKGLVWIVDVSVDPKRQER
jgi:hypothetical protein